MSEQQHEDEVPTPPRRSVEVALARVEAKLDVAIAQHSAKLDEHGRDIAELKATDQRLGDRVGQIEQRQAAADATKPRRVDWASTTQALVALAILLYLVLDHTGH